VNDAWIQQTCSKSFLLLGPIEAFAFVSFLAKKDFSKKPTVFEAVSSLSDTRHCMVITKKVSTGAEMLQVRTVPSKLCYLFRNSTLEKCCLTNAC